MNKLRKALVAIVAALSIGGFTACKNDPGQQQTENKNFEGLTLANATVTYDGQPHSISVAGNLPEGAQVSYGQAGNSFTEVGQHSIQAVISAEGYNSLTLNAVLTIVNADFAGLSLTDLTVTYDGQPHKIEVAGELPTGAQVSYGDLGNEFTAPGVYNIAATVTCTGYTTLNLDAVLTINKMQFEGIVFEGATVAYDGQPHSVEATVPQAYLDAGAEVSYGDGGNTFTNAGMHFVTATVSLENYDDYSKTVALTIGDNGVATAPFVVSDFEDIETDADLNDEFKLTFNKDGSSWVVPGSAKMTLEDRRTMGFDSANKVMRLGLTHQGYAFRVEKDISESFDCKKYSGFALDAYMDDREPTGEMKLSFNLWLKDVPLPDQYAAYRNTYISFIIDDACPGVWAHYDIPFTDNSMTIADLTHDQSVLALSAAGISVEDLTPYIEKVSINIKQNFVANGNCIAYLDNIALTRETVATRRLDIFSGIYGFESGNDKFVTIDLADSLTTASFKVNGTEEAQLTVERTDSTVIFKDSLSSGAGLTVVAEITKEGALHVTHIEGAAESTYAYLSGATATKIANLNYNLQDKASGSALSDKNWLQEKDNNGWVKASNQMNVRNYNSNIYCNMVTGYSMTNRYTYRNDKNVGLANRLSVKLANNFSTNADIKAKIKLIPFSGPDKFIAGGDGDVWEVIPAGAGNKDSVFDWIQLNYVFDAVQVKAISFIIKGFANASQYLYFDDLQLSYIPSFYPSVSAVSIAPNEATVDVTLGNSVDLVATVTGANDPSQAVSWYSSNEAVATVNSNGKVTGVAEGTAKIYAYSSIDPTKRGECAITVTDTSPMKSGHYYYIDEVEGDVYFIDVAGSGCRVRIEGGAAFDVAISFNGNEVTFTDTSFSGTGLVIVGTIGADGYELSSVTGSFASSFSFLEGETFVKTSTLKLDFEDGAGQGTYTNSHWSEKKWDGSTYVARSLDMNSRSKFGSKNVNMPCSTTGQIWIYTHDNSLGPVNHINIDLSHYFSSGITIYYRIAIFDKDGNQTWATGNGTDQYQNMYYNADVNHHLSLDFNSTVAVGFGVYAKTASGTGYLYMDNVEISYK